MSASAATDTTAGADQRSSVPAILWDALAVLVFAILARLAHNTESDPFTLTNVLNTYWPFLIGSVGAGVVLMAMGRNLRLIVPSGLIVWVATVVVGLSIWGVRHGSVPHWSFILVATIMSGLVLLGWRSGYLMAMRARSKESNRQTG